MDLVHTKPKVDLIFHTPDAEQLLVFSKRTRHMSSIDSYQEVLDMSEEEIRGNLDYVFNTIASSWEFVDYIFLICDVTRAFTHQLVRHRVGVAFAQQAQRVATMEEFGYTATGSCTESEVYHQTMRDIQQGYWRLINEEEARPQDARGVLPTNIHTNILFKVNLRALSDMLCTRLCVRAQGEFQNVAREMQKLVVSVHPWANKILGPNCIRFGVCKFPKFQDCPIKKRFPFLNGITDSIRNNIRSEWVKSIGFDPQPTIHSWKE